METSEAMTATCAAALRDASALAPRDTLVNGACQTRKCRIGKDGIDGTRGTASTTHPAAALNHDGMRSTVEASRFTLPRTRPGGRGACMASSSVMASSCIGSPAATWFTWLVTTGFAVRAGSDFAATARCWPWPFLHGPAPAPAASQRAALVPARRASCVRGLARPIDRPASGLGFLLEIAGDGGVFVASMRIIAAPATSAEAAACGVRSNCTRMAAAKNAAADRAAIRRAESWLIDDVSMAKPLTSRSQRTNASGRKQAAIAANCGRLGGFSLRSGRIDRRWKIGSG